jgi:dTDP-4-amino-4,6-dideoxygalactose transaminase
MGTWKKRTKRAFRNGMFSNGGENWNELNSLTETFFPGRKAIGVANNTVGQIAALQALNVKDSLVFLSNFTFAATLQAVLQAGGIPIVCDCDSTTWELSEETIKAGINQYGKPKVVLLTRVFGKRDDLTSISSFLKREGIILLLDSAAAFPSSKVVDSNLNEVFSLHATKAFGVGEGGIVVGEPNFVEETWRRCNFGLSTNQKFMDGSNAKMDEFTAARAISGIENYAKICEKRRKFVQLTYGELETNQEIKILENKRESIWSLFPIRFHSENQLLRFKEVSIKLGLTGKRYYWPSIVDGYIGDYPIRRVDNLVESQFASKLIYCLPVYSKFTRKETVHISEIMQVALRQALEA